jgi:hypothetical protein
MNPDVDYYGVSEQGSNKMQVNAGRSAVRQRRPPGLAGPGLLPVSRTPGLGVEVKPELLHAAVQPQPKDRHGEIATASRRTITRLDGGCWSCCAAHSHRRLQLGATSFTISLIGAKRSSEANARLDFTR